MPHQNKQTSKLKVSKEMVIKNIVELFNIVLDIVSDYLKDKEKDKVNDKVFYSMLCVRVFRRVITEDYSVKKIITNEEMYNKLMTSAFTNEKVKDFGLTEDELNALYSAILGLSMRYYVLGDIARVMRIINEEVKNVKKELFQGMEPKIDEHTKDEEFRIVNSEIKIEAPPNVQKKPKSSFKIELEDDATVQLFNKTDTPRGDSKEKDEYELPEIDSIKLLDDLLEGISDETEKKEGENSDKEKRIKKIKEMLKTIIYPRVNELLISYNVSTEKIVGNIKLGQIAVVLGVRPEDIKIIIESYPYKENLPVNPDSRMFKGDLNETFELVNNLAKNIERKKEKVYKMLF